ncbi:MAG: exodeoxyribonuclease VII large subunit [Candidatus Aminicenantaceae bacterium]
MAEKSPFKQNKIYTVSEITKIIKEKLESAFPHLWVEGEISNFHRHHSGHLYFTLKDEHCALKAVMFRSNAMKIPFELKDGLQIICKGRINIYEPRGVYQLLTELIEPKGKGALQLAFEQLKKKLKDEGLFDQKHKKKLPLFPKKVGVVTSSKGAAIVDIIKTLERRFARLHILIYPVKVQGKGASEEIEEGIQYLSQIPDIDVIIVGRGGGSIEDLWAFNEEKVARAIFRCPIPVISAVGHEIDFTISDFVADIRASTPSIAAEMVIEKEQSFEERIEHLGKGLMNQMKYILQEKKHKIFSLVHHKAFQNFKIKLLNLEQQIDELETKAWNYVTYKKQELNEYNSKIGLYLEKMRNKIKNEIQFYSGKWEKLSAQLNNLSPLNILKKGYTICHKKENQQIIRKIDEVKIKDEIIVSFFKGQFTCSVKNTDKEILIETQFQKNNN